MQKSKSKLLGYSVPIPEQEFRQILYQMVSGASAGMWLLVPEFVRLVAWDIIKAWTGKTDMDLDPCR